MDLLQNIMKISSEIGTHYIESKIKEKTSFAKKTVIGLYIGNLLISALTSLLVFLIGLSIIYSFFNGASIMPNLTSENLLISSLVVLITLSFTLLYLYIGSLKKNTEKSKTKETLALIEKVLPSIERIVFQITENNSVSKEIVKLKKQNEKLKKMIENLKKDPIE